jgi:hypothetical protein
MMAPRKENRHVFRRRRRSGERLDDPTARVRSEARATAKRERAELRRARAQAWAGRIAPYFSRALMLIFTVPAALIALLLTGATAALGWLRDRTVPTALGVADFLSIHVRPAGTVAFVAAAAAVALGVSQFYDYSGVEVSASLYAGEVGTKASVPLTDLERAGDAHLWVLLPVALAALVLTWQTYRGRWRLGRLVGALGLLAVLVSLAIDLPQGLDSGRAGVSFSDTQAAVIEGFWAQLSAAAVLVFCGPLLGSYVRKASAPGDLRRRGGDRSWRLSGLRRPRRPRPVVAARGEARF